MKELLLLRDLGALLLQIKNADKAYETDEPIIDDQQYDSIVDSAFLNLKKLEQLGATKSDYPLMGAAEEYLKKMRDSNVNNKKRSLEMGHHLSKVSGLDKVFTLEEFHEYMNEDNKTAGLAGSYYYLEPKYDGINISLIYENGELTKILTRGDGTTGEDLSPLIKGLESIPITVFWKEPTQINGELLISNESFEKINSNAKKKFKTPRSALMGFINSRDRFRLRTYAEFLPYSKTANNRHEKKVSDLKRNNFNEQAIRILNETMTRNTVKQIQNGIKSPAEIIGSSKYPLDGVVITHSNTLRSVAVKHKFISYTTTKVKGVRWNISGKLAKLTCSLIVDPVTINKKVYTNMPFKDLTLIDNNEVMINQQVVVSLDDNALKYESSVKDNTVVNLQKIIRPVLCPRCLEPLANKGYDYFCKHEKCIGALTSSFNKLNKALDLNMSTTFVGTMIDDGVDDLYKYLKKLIESSNLFKISVKEAKLGRILSAFNIPNFTPKDYTMLAEMMELTSETCDINALRNKVHKLSLKDKTIVNYKRKMAFYYTFCEFNEAWIKDFFDLLESIRRG